MVADQSLITKYRPASFEEVVGHEPIIAALRRAIGSTTRPHAFLFTGPAGVGKTSLARIVASDLGAEVLEIDAASQGSKEGAREIIEMGQFRPLSGAAYKMIIVDECHGLSSAAFDVLLKILEEPPEHLFFALCTTELHKVRETIVSRCYHVPLRPLPGHDIEDLLAAICDLEGWKVDGDVMQMVITAATGQPRKALSMIQACHDAPSREEARRIIALLEPTDAIMDLLRDITSGRRSWQGIRQHLQRLTDEDFDALAATSARYLATAMVGQEREDQASKIWRLLDALTFPTSTYDRRAAFMAAVGRMLWAAA